MSRRRKKKDSDEHINETWLLPYSDLLTLLVALFIVLFAMSAVDAQKFQAISEVFKTEFSGGTGVFEFFTPVPEGGTEAIDKKEKEEDNEKELDNELTAQQLSEQEKLAEIQKRVNAYVKANGLDNLLVTSLSIEGLSVTIRDKALFNSGSADVRPEDLAMAREISNLLVMDVPRTIIVSGHTDNVPISNAEFESNWELSVMRAINFMKILLENDQLNPELFSAKGYGEFQPVATNDTEEGRAKNRRVEIFILPQIEN